MVVTIALAAVIFLALAGALAGALRSLAVQKARTQGNEVATLGIESLQNLKYDSLGMCAPAPGAPNDLDEPASPAATCDAAVLASSTWETDNPGWGEHPCRAAAPTSGAGFVRSSYSCVRNNLTYTVRRYVAWGDDAQTTKRLAVFVKWRDNVGDHEVSQQSSLRAPGVQDIAGLPTPKITALSIATVPAPNPATVAIDPVTGNPTGGNIALTATTSGLTAGASTTTLDKVYVTFSVLDATNTPDVVSAFLTSANGTNWTGNIPSTYRFGKGTQYITFSTIREKDGKGNAVISPKVTFTDGSVTPVPSFTTFTAQSSAGGTTVQIAAGGALVPDHIQLSATTTGSTAADTVKVVFETRTGAVTAGLQPTVCTGTGNCTWTGTIPREAGYSFSTGVKTFYFTISQPFTGPGTGSTSAESRDVTFTL